MSKLFHREDDTRLVHYEGIFHDIRFNETSDMESQMYTKAADIEDFLNKNPEKPFICCEYTHSMGNSNGAMHKYTELTDSNPRYQGGFIWDFIDQSIYAKDRYGKAYLAYGGDFGDRPTDYNFCTNGIVYADRTISPKMQEVKFNYQNISILPEKEISLPIKEQTTPGEYTVIVSFHLKEDTSYSNKSFLHANGSCRRR